MASATAIHGIHLVATSDARRMDYDVVHQLLTAVATQCVKEQRTVLIAKSIAESPPHPVSQRNRLATMTAIAAQKSASDGSVNNDAYSR